PGGRIPPAPRGRRPPPDARPGLRGRRGRSTAPRLGPDRGGPGARARHRARWRPRPRARHRETHGPPASDDAEHARRAAGARPLVRGVLLTLRAGPERRLVLAEAARGEGEAVRAPEAVGERLGRLVERWPAAEDRFQRGHAGERIALPGKHPAKPRGLRA